MSNRGIYKRAVKDLTGAEGSVRYEGEDAVVSISGETCTIRDPLWESRCTCPSRSVCRHLVTAILWLRGQLVTEDDAPAEPPELPEETDGTEITHTPETVPEENPPAEAALPEEPPVLSEKAAAPVREQASQSLELLADVLRWGIVRLPENMAEHLEAAAVRCHALRMADAERQVRELGTLLRMARERRAVFKAEEFLGKLTRTAAYLEELQGDTLPQALLGQFKRTYLEVPGDLHLLPVGQREVASEDYEGELFYFLNLDDDGDTPFLTFSDLRPTYYEGLVNDRLRVNAPWNAGCSMKTLMHSRLTLTGAKLSGDKLSSSKETNVVSRTKADLNCDAVRRLIFQDFRALAVWLGEQERHEEHLCFICAEKCLASRFDTHAQQLRMTMRDHAGNTVDIRVGYRRESREFIEELERIGRIMLEVPDKPYVWLCSARFEEGELMLFPIEVYNFITPDEPALYRLPLKFTVRSGVYAPKILALFDVAEEWLCALLQSGIRTAPASGGEELAQKAADLGMEGLRSLLLDLGQKAAGYRHDLAAAPLPVLRALTAVSHYLTIGREKLEVISALYAMRSE